MRELEHIVPGLAEARASERQNRGLAFAGLTHTVLGLEVVPLTPRTRLGLQLVRNAFLAGVAPLAGDVFQVLWYLSPRFSRRPGLLGILARRRAHALSKAVNLPSAEREIHEYLAAQLQDQPGQWSDEDGADHSNHVYWTAWEASFWLGQHGGFTLDQYLDTPYLVLQQLYRAWQISNPPLIKTKEGHEADEPTFVNRSDSIYRSWYREHASLIGALVRANSGDRN